MAFKMDKAERAKNREAWNKWTGRGKPEEEKENGAVPFLNIGSFEKRDEGNGALMVFFEGTNTTIKSAHVSVGKFKYPRDEYKVYYVSDYTKSNWAAPNETTYHEHLLMAIARVYELKQAFEERNGHVHTED